MNLVQCEHMTDFHFKLFLSVGNIQNMFSCTLCNFRKAKLKDNVCAASYYTLENCLCTGVWGVRCLLTFTLCIFTECHWNCNKHTHAQILTSTHSPYWMYNLGLSLTQEWFSVMKFPVGVRAHKASRNEIQPLES